MIRLCTSFAVLPVLAVLCPVPCIASVTLGQDQVYSSQTDGVEGTKVTFDVPAGTLIAYANDEDCSANHKTANQNRFYSHCHITYTFPKTGLNGNNVPETVDETSIRNHWNWKYKGYDPSGSESNSQNCFGYALGIDTWIQDAAYIKTDDYQPASGYADVEVFLQAAHAIRVTNRQEGTYFWTISTSEKNECSRIYSSSYTYSAPGGDKIKRKYLPQ